MAPKADDIPRISEARELLATIIEAYRERGASAELIVRALLIIRNTLDAASHALSAAVGLFAKCETPDRLMRDLVAYIDVLLAPDGEDSFIASMEREGPEVAPFLAPWLWGRPGSWKEE